MGVMIRVMIMCYLEGMAVMVISLYSITLENE